MAPSLAGGYSHQEIVTMLPIRLSVLVLLIASTSAHAVPSLARCNQPDTLRDNVYFDESCTTAYVGLPDYGSASVDSLYRANTGLCKAYKGAVNAHTSTVEAMTLLIKKKNDLALQELDIQQRIGSLRLQASDLEVDLDIAQQDELRLLDDLNQVEDALAIAKDEQELCDINNGSAACDVERDEVRRLQSQKRTVRRFHLRAKSIVRSRRQQVELINSRMADLNHRTVATYERLDAMTDELGIFQDKASQRMTKYTTIYGGTASLLFQVDHDGYVRKKRADAANAMASLQWRPVLPRNARLQFVANYSSPSVDEIQRHLLPVLSISTPDFGRYGTVTQVVDQPPETPVSISELTSRDIGEFQRSQTPLPAAFNSQINMNLHGACMVDSENKQDLLAYVSPVLSAQYELKGRAGYRATVKQNAMIDFLKKMKGGRFFSFSYVKTKIRERHEYDTLVDIEYTADTSEGQQLNTHYKRTLAANILERASVAIMDSIAVRSRPVPSMLALAENKPDTNSWPNQLASLSSGVNMSSLMCRTAGTSFCSMGWDLDAVSFSSRSHRYVGTVGATYQETIKDVYFVPVMNTLTFK